jgi:hypothetical protein
MMNMMPGMPGAMPQQGAAGGGGMSLPQLLAMIQGSQGGGAGGMPQMQGPSGATPMANYIGPQAGGGGMMHPAMAPVGNPQPQGGAPTMGGAGSTGSTDQLMKILAQLRGGQTGVPSGQAGVPGNTPSALSINSDGSISGTPGQPAPWMQRGPAGAPNFAALQAAGAFQQPPAAGGAQQSGQMDPSKMQWLQHLFSGFGGGGAG